MTSTVYTIDYLLLTYKTNQFAGAGCRQEWLDRPSKCPKLSGGVALSNIPFHWQSRVYVGNLSVYVYLILWKKNKNWVVSVPFASHAGDELQIPSPLHADSPHSLLSRRLSLPTTPTSGSANRGVKEESSSPGLKVDFPVESSTVQFRSSKFQVEGSNFQLKLQFLVKSSNSSWNF